MRASFDRLCSLKYGPSSVVGPAGMVFATDVPVRKVPQKQIDQLQFPFNLAAYWVTIDNRRLNGPTYNIPFVGGVRESYLACDQIQFNDQIGQWWVVCREEKVKPYGQPQYWRYLIFSADLMNVVDWLPHSSPPPPPPPPPPIPSGASCSETEDLSGASEYAIETAPGGDEGYYSIPMGTAGPVTVTLLAAASATTMVRVRAVPIGTSCCIEGYLLGELTQDGVTAVMGGPYPEWGEYKLCVFIQDTEFGVLDTTALIGVTL